MIRKISGFLLAMLIIAFMVFSVNDAFARGNQENLTRSLQKGNIGEVESLINIGNWGYWFWSSGVSAHDPYTGSSGGYWPRGTTTVIYLDGLIWGGMVHVDDTTLALRSGGNAYASGTQAGWIDDQGVAHPGDERARIYRIRADVLSLSEAAVVQDAAELYNVSAADVTADQTNAVLTQYKKDWAEWPVDLGAPFYDVNGNGVYDPVTVKDAETGYDLPVPAERNEDGTWVSDPNTGDFPGIGSADQVAWYVVNDMGGSSQTFAGSDPMQLEVQVTTFAFAQPEYGLGQIVFKSYKIINKSPYDISDMYIMQWCDPDVGDYGDDLAGCDEDLSMMFAYNGKAIDNTFKSFNMPPGAVGYDFFQGPMVPSPGDTAIFDLKIVLDHKNLPMTSFGYFGSGTLWSDPGQGTYTATKQWYNLLRGYAPTDDVNNPTEFIHETGLLAGKGTKFPLNGDPVNGNPETDDLDGVTYEYGDRRMLQSTGPFDMAASDTQQVVVAVLAGLGGDRLQSVDDLKKTDEVAQAAYNTLFDKLPKPPSAPQVDVFIEEDQIVLDWSWDETALANTEKSQGLGYTFEGYNVYQLPNATAKISDPNAKKIATYDVVNGILEIRSNIFVPQYGTVVWLPVQNGTDSGVKRYLKVTQDEITNTPFKRGSTYYFAVTAYNFNPKEGLIRDRALESAAVNYGITIQGEKPGVRYGASAEDDVSSIVEHVTGTAGGAINLQIINPEKITGDNYDLSFYNKHFYRDENGEWKETNYPDSVGKGLAKALDISASTITGAAIYAENPGTADIIFTLSMNGPGGAWADGVKLDFPSEVTINSFEAISGAYGSYPDYGQNITNTNGTQDGNSITWGDNALSTFGAIEGTCYMTVHVQNFTPPISVGFTIYDDGYDSLTVNATGTVTIDEIGYEFKTVNMWQVANTVSGDTVIKDATSYGSNMPLDAPTAEGFRVSVDGSFAAPAEFSSVTKIAADGTETIIDDKNSGGTDDIGAYGLYGWAASSRSVDTYGQGTTDVDKLIIDYEIRWTGEYEDVQIDNPATGSQILYHKVKDGTGSMAMIYGARGYTLDQHPLNPDAGSTDPFMVRIPFEVWDAENNVQVNIIIYDRKQDPATATEWYAFNPNDRMYTEFLLIPYKETLPTAADLDNLTWNLVWWTTPLTTGDKMLVKYPNPIQLGKDLYRWSTADYVTTYSEADEKADVDKLNVFPNPYYGMSSMENSRFNRFVTLNHLPQKATIRIYNLAGIQVRKLEKDNADQFYRWDLQNESGLPVASGVYIIHVDMPDLGKTKVLKAFIVQSQQILEYY